MAGASLACGRLPPARVFCEGSGVSATHLRGDFHAFAFLNDFVQYELATMLDSTDGSGFAAT